MRQTKIVATVGPASASVPHIEGMIAAGADILRLNFSHGTHATHAETFARIRAAARQAGRPVAIMQDLGGPKIRTGALDGGVPLTLTPGDVLRIATGPGPGRAGLVTTPFAALATSVSVGDRLLLADGALEVTVTATDGRVIDTVVVEGGTLGEHKGIHAPGVTLPASALTLKDLGDLQFGLDLGVDLVALSFVQDAADLERARQVCAEHGHQPGLVAKIERSGALTHLDAILRASDAVMVARGDLGLELPLEEVPGVQKRITARARALHVPVIVATQVLESMLVETRPTRAEVSDAANAVADGVDAIMLSGETAAGAHPVAAVQMLDRVIRAAEVAQQQPRASVPVEHGGHTTALCAAAVALATGADAVAIVAVTRGGETARRLSALRPPMPVLATTDRDDMTRRLAPYWGVTPVCTTVGEDVPAAPSRIGEHLVARGLVPADAVVVFVSVNDDRTRPDANYVHLQQL